MQVIRDPEDTLHDEPSVRARVTARARERGEEALAVWAPRRHLSVGPRDRRNGGFDRAAQAARERGFPVVIREMGGHPVALTGTTLALVWAVPNAADDLGDRYRHVRQTVRSALETVGVSAHPGAPPASFCPGTYGLSADGKLAGFAQRVHRDVAAVGGIIIVDGHGEIAEVLDPVYRALDLPFDPSTVDSIAKVGGATPPDGVREAILEAFQADRTI